MTATLLERPAFIDVPRPIAPTFRPSPVDVVDRAAAAGDRPGTPAGDEPTGGRAGRRTAAFVLAGGAPLVAAAACVLGLAPPSAAPLVAVVPLVVVALVAVLTRIDGGRWARTGMLAGLASVAACYVLELPLVAAGAVPDFVPGVGDPAGTGGAWSMLGDTGAAMFAFMMVGLALVVRPHLINRHTVAAGAGYLIFVWTGLMGALMLPGGPETAFTLSPTGFVAHLAYGALLAVGLPIAVRHITSRRSVA